MATDAATIVTRAALIIVSEVANFSKKGENFNFLAIGSIAFVVAEVFRRLARSLRFASW